MLLLMGHQVVRSRLAVILEIKELATHPVSQDSSHSGAHIYARYSIAKRGDGMRRCFQIPPGLVRTLARCELDNSHERLWGLAASTMPQESVNDDSA